MVNQSLVSVGSTLSGFKQFQITATAEAQCPRHSAYIENTFATGRVSRCPECDREATAKQEAEENEARKAADQERKERFAAELMGNSGLTPRFATKTIKGYVVESQAQADIVERIKVFGGEFAQGHSGRNLALIGNTGTGKSHLAAALVGYVIRKLNRPARFMSVSALSRMILESKDFKKAKYTESQVIEAMASLELLVIDEFGVQSGSDAESRALFDVFNTRYEHMKPTIFISNLQLDGFAAAVGGRIMSRLREDGGEILSFNWEDCRK